MASKLHLFLCNGGTLPRSAAGWRKVAANELSTDPDNGNVRIQIPELARTMFTNVPPVLADLAEIAAIVYVADQSVSRSGIKSFDYGDKWLRHFRFEIGVRSPDFWNQTAVVHALEETLGFLTEDTFEFRFTTNPNPTPFTKFLGFNECNPEGIERAILFSGGIDSFVGAAEEVLHFKRKAVLVSHKPVSIIGAKQKQLVQKITDRLVDADKSPLHLNVVANKTGSAPEHDHTQRSRSFLFTAIGAVVARMFGLRSLEFYENGVVSVNLPLCDQETNARASRTTHPQSLFRFSELLAHVCGEKFDVTNHYVRLTKQDVVERAKDIGHSDLIRDTISCTHTRLYRVQQPHCGLCSQCLSRRIATLGAASECCDPDSDYRSHALLSPRIDTKDRTLAERFVGVARQIEAMSDVMQFQQTFANDLGRVSPYLVGSNRDVIASLFDLHYRHAVQTGEAIEQAMKRHVHEFRTGQLPDTCTLWFAFRLGQSTANEGKAATRLEDDRQVIEEIENQVSHLNKMDRKIIYVLFERNVHGADFDKSPSQKTLAEWACYEFDTTFKNALAALVKSQLIDNGRHHGRQGGYFLTDRGLIAGKVIHALFSHD